MYLFHPGIDDNDFFFFLTWLIKLKQRELSFELSLEIRHIYIDQKSTFKMSLLKKENFQK